MARTRFVRPAGARLLVAAGLALAGTAHALPLIDVTPLNADFGTGGVGVQRNITITLTNVSGANVTMSLLSFGFSPSGASANWSYGPAGVVPCNANTVLAPAGSCTFQHSVIQNQPGTSLLTTTLTITIVSGGDETLTLPSVARSDPVSVPALAPPVVGLLAGLIAVIAGLFVRRRRAGA